MSGKIEKPCLHYAAGKCTRGLKCRFMHEGKIAPVLASSAAVNEVDDDGNSASEKTEYRDASKSWRKRPGKQWRTRKIEEDEGTAAATENVVPVKRGVEIPVCKGHKTPCLFRKVTKRGSNFGREYWVCAWSGEAGRKRCGYFRWADAIISSRGKKRGAESNDHSKNNKSPKKLKK